MDREIHVYLDLERTQLRVGTLWARSRPGRENASFEYDPGWLAHPKAFPLEPALPLNRGQMHTKRKLFATFTDAAPDRWGEILLQRNEDRRTKKLGHVGRTLLAADFLIGVEDETRMGALRFKNSPDGPFLSKSGVPVPPLIELRKLLSAANRVAKGKETDEDLQLLLAPGSSLGGQRPKASVRDTDGSLLLAKFPRDNDKWSVPRWEAVALALAEQAHITVPRWRLEYPTKAKPALITKRFDRSGVDVRIPFMSALTASNSNDNEGGSYLDIAEVLRQEGIAPTEDLMQLWRRMVFNILISNADDHLRNHGFVWIGGWRLSPAYDLNPYPDKRGFHAIAFNETDRDASIEVALSVAPSFGLSDNEAAGIVLEVAEAVKNWRVEAKRTGLGRAEIDRMAMAFEHDHLEQALAMVPPPAHAKKPIARRRESANKRPRAKAHA